MTDDRTGKKALAVFAHPDDETLLAGALIPMLIAEGWNFQLLCVAPGDEDDRVRRMESAAYDLGISRVSSLRFAPLVNDASSDIGPKLPLLASAPESVVADQIAGKITEVGPNMILTHSPKGDYGHLDHIICHRATVKAAVRTGSEAVVYALAWSKRALWIHSLIGRVARLVTRSVDKPVLDQMSSAAAAMGEGSPDHDLADTRYKTHRVNRFLDVRKRASRHYAKELAQGPLSLRLLEASPTWLQRPILGQARLMRVR